MIKNEKNAELARKFMAELPEQLAPQLGSTENEKGQLKVFPLPRYSKLQGADIQLITQIARSYFKGDYVNSGNGFYWLFPIPDVQLPTSPLDKTEQEIKNVQNIGASQNVYGDNLAAAGPAPPVPEPAPNDAKPSPTPEPPKPAPQEKPKEETPKQPSPLSVFMERYCSTCADQSDGCNPKNAAGREKMQRCFEVLQLLFLGDIRDNLLKPRQFFRRGSGSRPQTQPNSQPQQPESYFLENGIVWAKSQTSSNKPCDKAYEEKNRKDGVLNQEYAQLVDAASKKKGFGGFYYYIVDGPCAYVGRIKTEKKEGEPK
ncbi:MAG: hypothetical protein PHI16_03940 [Methanocellales archaeon]|nr:hypothetical protein [Methanocellales archaeon]